MIQYVGFLLLILLLIWLLLICKPDYNSCYDCMEQHGNAAFGMCCGQSGGKKIRNICQRYASIVRILQWMTRGKISLMRNRLQIRMVLKNE